MKSWVSWNKWNVSMKITGTLPEEIAQLVKQIQDDHITSNESAGKGWPLQVVYRCHERL